MSVRLLAPVALVAAVVATAVVVTGALSDEEPSRVMTAARTTPPPGELRDVAGAEVGAMLPEDIRTELVPGPGRGDRTTSLRAKAQQAAAQALGDRRGSVVAIEVATGDVLVLAGDHPTRRTVPLGATVDVLLLAAALDAQAITADSTLNGPAGAVTLEQALGEPVPEAIADVRSRLGPERITAALVAAGAGDRVPFTGLPSKLRGSRSAAPESFTDPETGLAIDLGTQVRSPVLGLALIAAAVAKDGKAPRPDLVPEGARRSAGRLWTADASAVLRPLLRAAVTNGASRGLRSPSVEIAGWTTSGSISTAVGYAPATSPEWAFAAAVQGSGAGALAVTTAEALAG